MSDLVLDVGSGHNPHPAADVLVERFVEDALGHRGGEGVKHDGRPIVLADGARLPFRDGAFACVYARHVAEHVPDVAAFLEELSRVGRSGYLECPSLLYEVLCDPEVHRWNVGLHDGVLLFQPKLSRGPLAGRLFEVLSDRSWLFRLLLETHPDLFYVRHWWRDRIHFRVLGRDDSVLPLQDRAALERLLPTPGSVARGALKRLATDAIRAVVPRRVLGLRHRYAGLRARPVAWAGLLACPRCRGPVTPEGDGWGCPACRVRYGRTQGFLDFVT